MESTVIKWAQTHVCMENPVNSPNGERMSGEQEDTVGSEMFSYAKGVSSMAISSWSAGLVGVSLLLAAPIVLAQGTPPVQPSGSGSSGCDYTGYDRTGTSGKPKHADEGEEINSRTATYVCHNGKLIKKS